MCYNKRMSPEQMSKNDPVNILKNYRDRVWPEIESYLTNPEYPKQFVIPPKFRSVDEFHWDAVKDYPERKGKYLRPTLLVLTYEALGGKIETALKTAAAMQVSEDWLLIHDDLEDESLERRGKPTLHLIYGSNVAINAGDALQIIMWKILNDNYQVLDKNVANELANEFYRILSRTALGQNAEAKWTKENLLDMSDYDWFFIADGKTAYYTIAGPMRLGAILAGASEDQLDRITEFGLNLGRCFQIVDDVLDLTSDFGGLKKQTGNDIYEGKRTLMLGHLLRSTDGKDRERLIAILAKPRDKKTQEEVDWVITAMNEAGSIKHARTIATELKNRALEIFDNDLSFLSTEPARSHLKTLINFVLERDR